jgi:predicted anti-sigma-YlaC factor YlaD
VNCEYYRQAISARLDGEDAELEISALETHLATCPDCQEWADAAAGVSRRMRVSLAEPVPDLAPAIMASFAAEAARPAPSPRRGPRLVRPRTPVPASPVGIARLGLALVAMAQLAIAVPALLGSDAGAPVHIAREQGSWALALAVGLLFAAWRPARASGVLPIMAALVACLTVTTLTDVAAGRTVATSEAPHGLAMLGVMLLWVLAHPDFGHRTTHHRQVPAG